MEKYKKMIPIQVTKTCDKCGGEMKTVNDTVLTTYPVQYIHICKGCGYTANYLTSYPTIIEYEEDEANSLITNVNHMVLCKHQFLEDDKYFCKLNIRCNKCICSTSSHKILNPEEEYTYDLFKVIRSYIPLYEWGGPISIWIYNDLLDQINMYKLNSINIKFICNSKNEEDQEHFKNICKILGCAYKEK